MTTLIECHGALQGRCDAKCYDAQGPNCNCICGGRNHGAGIDVATEYVRELTKKQLADIEKRGGLIPDELRQSELFG